MESCLPGGPTIIPFKTCVTLDILPTVVNALEGGLTSNTVVIVTPPVVQQPVAQVTPTPPVVVPGPSPTPAEDVPQQTPSPPENPPQQTPTPDVISPAQPTTPEAVVQPGPTTPQAAPEQGTPAPPVVPEQSTAALEVITPTSPPSPTPNNSSQYSRTTSATTLAPNQFSPPATGPHNPNHYSAQPLISKCLHSRHHDPHFGYYKCNCKRCGNSACVYWRGYSF